ncbi:Mannitol 2-dehydrogenase [Symbiodinium microadriaticum]|uniref:mannitol 2-dehydrogenase n=1 Tax=Symbiodinium microadriaticum TaxID=2951 RepID=A0A1Q9E1C7_SYMMI|nr:Mannitol 2-dehydrogenase [Symbiodinium microadriaticum]
MKLCSANLEKICETGAVKAPKYDRSKVQPGIVHIGVGNFHRAHQCVFVEDTLELPGQESWAYRGVGLMPGDVKMRDILKEQDMMYALWQRGTDTEEVRVIGCHQEFYLATEDSEAILDLLSAAETKIVTLTVTEKGYFVNFATGKLDTASPAVASDIEALKAGKATLKTAAGFLVATAARRRSGAGTRAVDKELATWISENVSFPNSMVDRITPATTEDKFPCGRAAWDKSTSGKCIFVEDVLPYELMKLRLLNGVHQALSYPAALLGHALVHEALADARISGFLKVYMAAAGRTVPPVEGLGKEEWCRTVLDRFGNPAVRDTIFRLNEDATNRMAVSLAPCLEEDAVPDGPPLSRIEIEALVLPVSCWVRQLVGADAKLAEKSPKAEIPALNRDDKSGVVTGPALAAWAAAGSAQEAAASFLETAFGAKAARPEVTKVLADQLQILKEKDVEALLHTVCGGA